jgi:hypothetical protein
VHDPLIDRIAAAMDIFEVLGGRAAAAVLVIPDDRKRLIEHAGHGVSCCAVVAELAHGYGVTL